MRLTHRQGATLRHAGSQQAGGGAQEGQDLRRLAHGHHGDAARNQRVRRGPRDCRHRDGRDGRQQRHLGGKGVGVGGWGLDKRSVGKSGLQVAKAVADKGKGTALPASDKGTQCVPLWQAVPLWALPTCAARARSSDSESVK